uniref:Peptidase C1A papain C-terminal domain-containing protein n=1 Tax=Stomoxys calcitrans TaxID=35570 RepID=A0A1I8NRG6_STOCA
MAKIAVWLTVLILAAVFDLGSLTYVPQNEWDAYVLKYRKTYPDKIAENNARYYYAVNKNMIDAHNAKYNKGMKTFSLAVNQFTDMRLIHFNALFPVTTPLAVSHATVPPLVMPGGPTYNPKSFGYTFNVEDQGIKCNSGWAYASVKAIEILKAIHTANYAPVTLSAQNMIDCAGSSRACINQVPQTVFDYLTQYQMNLLDVMYYKNNNQLGEPGMCLPPMGAPVTKLTLYSVLDNDEDLKNYVASSFPVVVEVNPTSFEFMHYAQGIYQPPATTTKGSHFMTVIGYDIDYWIVQNSFGTTWGESGLMRIHKSANVKLAKNAIFPTQWA